jgi:hypothetical protein
MRKTMGKLIYMISLLILNIATINPKDKPDFSTILIIIEEQENENFVTEATPFSDGIFEALWKKEYIFFDMKIDKPINVVYDQLDVKQYFQMARESGADSLLLVKFHYSYAKDTDKRYRLNSGNTYYNLYSLNSMKSFGSGEIKSSINVTVDNANDKERYLRKAGFDILNEIFSR